jgi:hypothetical protein
MRLVDIPVLILAIVTGIIGVLSIVQVYREKNKPNLSGNLLNRIKTFIKYY